MEFVWHRLQDSQGISSHWRLQLPLELLRGGDVISRKSRLATFPAYVYKMAGDGAVHVTTGYGTRNGMVFIAVHLKYGTEYIWKQCSDADRWTNRKDDKWPPNRRCLDMDPKWGTFAHYSDVVMGAIASQITSLTIVYSIVYSDADQRKHQSSASLAFVRGTHREPVNSPHKWPETRKIFPFDDVIMVMERVTHRHKPECCSKGFTKAPIVTYIH